MHDLSIEEVLRRLDASITGLSDVEAGRRLGTVGPNTLREEHRRHPVILFLKQFTDVMILILLAAALIAGITGDITDTLVILAIVVLNGILGFSQEFRAERALAALRRLEIPRVQVTRDNRRLEIPSSELVPGDILHLNSGSRVPADSRLIISTILKVDESPLTGESVPVTKEVAPLPSETPLMERTNMVYMGTTVISGRGEAVVAATGMQTELGRIAHILQTTEKEKTPLQRRLTHLGKWLVAAALVICGVIFLAGLWRGEPPTVMLLTAVSLAVAAIPEGLPAVVAIVLALGAQRMAARRALIRKLPAVETLGCVTTICSDKTGTLTENRMSVFQLYLPDRTTPDRSGRWVEFPLQGPLPWSLAGSENISLFRLLETMALCNDAHWTAGRTPSSPLEADRVVGDPMEGALLIAAAQGGIDKKSLEAAFPRIAEIPFDSTRKRMVTLHRTETGFRLLMKGGIEEVLHCSDRTLSGASPVALTEETRSEILAANRRMAEGGLRVLAGAYLDIKQRPSDLHDAEKGLVFLGLAGIMDAPRPEAKAAVHTCLQAGIRPVMITGDHRITAEAVARHLGMLQEGEKVLAGTEFERIAGSSLAQEVEHVAVYARVVPEHKVRIVEALQQRGHIVAMTGDGVNDAPALKRANIGVAMGITGTDVSKEASDMVLLDDNFATIVAAVEEGRRIYDNIRKFIRYMLATNCGELLVLFFAIPLGMPLPLLPVQILWINLVTDGLPALALGAEPAERGVMKRPPRPPGESLFSRGLGWHILWVGLLMAAGSLGIFERALGQYPLGEAQSLVFYTLVMFQLFHVMAIRSERDSLFTQGVGSNPYLLGAVTLGIILQLALLYVPALQEIFHTAPPRPGDLFLCTLIASSVFFAVELEKGLVRKGLLWKT